MAGKARQDNPDFDIDVVRGEQAELWVIDIQRALAGKGEIEVKAPRPWLEQQSFYVEYECRLKKGWTPSGIVRVAKVKPKAWFIKFGSLPGGLVVETAWLLRAARLAYKKGKRKQCMRGDYPTHGVVVSLLELWETREHEP